MKKKIPLQVLETIEPYVKNKGVSFESVDSSGFLLKFIDKDNTSDFYFNVEEYKMDPSFQLLIDWKPINKQSIQNRKAWIKAEQLNTHFTNWLTLLEGYEKVKSVFDDPIIEAFTEEYYSEFEIIDTEADVKPFSTKQILLLDSHLENIEKKIEKFQTEENKLAIQKIKDNVAELRQNLTKKPKKWVIKQLSKVWAEITKQGPKFIKEFLNETKKTAIKESVKFIFENGINLINQ